MTGTRIEAMSNHLRELREAGSFREAYDYAAYLAMQLIESDRIGRAHDRAIFCPRKHRRKSSGASFGNAGNVTSSFRTSGAFTWSFAVLTIMMTMIPMTAFLARRWRCRIWGR